MSTKAKTSWAQSFIEGIKRRWSFPLSERVEFYDNMAEMTAADIPTEAALKEIALGHHSVGVKRKAALYSEMHTRLVGGKKLAKVLAPFIPRNELVLLGAGESSSIAEGFRSAGKVAAAVTKMRNMFIALISYPALLLFGGLLLIGDFSKELLPMVRKTVKPEQLSAENLAYLHFADFIQTYQWLLLGIALALVILIGWSLPRWRGPTRQVFDRWFPPYILYRQYVSAIMMMAMGSLCRSKVTVKDALRLLLNNANPYLAKHLTQILATYGGGRDEARAFNTGLLDTSIVIRINALSRAASMEDSLTRIGEGVVEYCTRTIVRTGGVIFVMSILLAGAFVVWTVTFINTAASGSSGLMS